MERELGFRWPDGRRERKHDPLVGHTRPGRGAKEDKGPQRGWALTTWRNDLVDEADPLVTYREDREETTRGNSHSSPSYHNRSGPSPQT